MPVLQRLRRDHAGALLAFERENRAFFAASIPDRGDDYFGSFDTRHSELLADQAAGLLHFHVLVDSEGEVRGGLVDVADGSAELGYRIAEKATKQGLATMAVHQVCELAGTEYELTSLRARTTLDNAGSRAVLARTGSVPTGDVLLSGRPGLPYARNLGTAPS
ncbi:MAG: GNAT family N-acetyltransferase [Actinopolymorphaceae bacterium]